MEISYTIEDLDAIEPAPLEAKKTPMSRICSCDTTELSADRDRGDLRRYQSVDTRWANTSFLSPDDAIRDLKKHARDGTEFRWELHTSSTDLDLARKIKCSCHSLTPEEKKRQDGVQRGDLRKHHSAETDKWSIKPDYLAPPMHDLRKHSSDDTRMAREVRWTLQVPEVLPNPKPRCTCPKSIEISPSPIVQPKDEETKEQKTTKEPEKRIQYSKSLTPEESIVTPIKRPELKKHASEGARVTTEDVAELVSEDLKLPSEDTRLPSEAPRLKKEEKVKERPKLVRSAHQTRSILSITGMSKKWEPKEKVSSPEEGKKPRPKWAMKPHFSLPAEKKESRWSRGQESFEGIKSKSLKERPKYSIRRSISPEPDPRQMTRLENRIVRRLISPEIMITDAKWAPYEDASPLPNVGGRKREQKHISEIKWTPYDGSPTDVDTSCAPPEPEESKNWTPFHHVTPTHHPPPQATPCRSDDEDERWRFLNQVAPFPLYQGGWKDESPERTPPKRVPTPEDTEPPIWSPQVPATPVKRQKSQQYSPQPPPPQPHRKSIVKIRGASKKKALRARSESGYQPDDRLAPPITLSRASSEEPKGRQRPQLIRSQALLEVPKTMDATKRSYSEEAPRMRIREHIRGPYRARSEEVPKYEDPWFANNNLASESTELRQYVTTV